MLSGIRRLGLAGYGQTLPGPSCSSIRRASPNLRSIPSQTSLAISSLQRSASSSLTCLAKCVTSSSTSLASFTPKRFLFSSPSYLTKKKFRKSIHSSPDGTDRLESDEQFHRIIADQKVRVAQLRAQENAKAAEADVEEMTEEMLDQPEGVSQAAKEARKALISKMVAKHVPLNNTDQAIEMFNTLIQSFVKIDSMDYVQELFEQMMANDLPPNRLTYNLLARGYSRHSPPLIEPLQRLMNMMVEDGGLDVFTFNALILSYAKLGRSCNPHEMFPLMRSHNVIEDISTCNLLFSTYSRVKDERSLELTETLLEWMRNNGIQPNSATYTSIIECCKDNHSRAMDFYEASLAAADAAEIPSEASEERLTAMLKVFGDSKQLQLALNFLEIFLAKYPSFQLSPANHGALFYLYTRCLHIKTAFDNLETYLNSLQEEGVSRQLCNIVISALRTLPEAALAENETNLNEWEEKLKEYPSRTLEEADAAEFKISLLHWRQTYTPSTPSTKAGESSKGN